MSFYCVLSNAKRSASVTGKEKLKISVPIRKSLIGRALMQTMLVRRLFVLASNENVTNNINLVLDTPCTSDYDVISVGQMVL